MYIRSVQEVLYRTVCNMRSVTETLYRSSVTFCYLYSISNRCMKSSFFEFREKVEGGYQNMCKTIPEKLVKLVNSEADL